MSGLHFFLCFLSVTACVGYCVRQLLRASVTPCVHRLLCAQTDLATMRDAMEATDEALAQKEQEAAYMVVVDGEI